METSFSNAEQAETVRVDRRPQPVPAENHARQQPDMHEESEYWYSTRSLSQLSPISRRRQTRSWRLYILLCAARQSLLVLRLEHHSRLLCRHSNRSLLHTRPPRRLQTCSARPPDLHLLRPDLLFLHPLDHHSICHQFNQILCSLLIFRVHQLFILYKSIHI